MLMEKKNASSKYIYLLCGTLFFIIFRLCLGEHEVSVTAYIMKKPLCEYLNHFKQLFPFNTPPSENIKTEVFQYFQGL